MKTRWILLHKGEQVFKGDEVHDWNSDTFQRVDDDVVDSDLYDPFIINEEIVRRRIKISSRELRKIKL